MYITLPIQEQVFSSIFQKICQRQCGEKSSNAKWKKRNMKWQKSGGLASCAVSRPQTEQDALFWDAYLKEDGEYPWDSKQNLISPREIMQPFLFYIFGQFICLQGFQMRSGPRQCSTKRIHKHNSLWHILFLVFGLLMVTPMERDWFSVTHLQYLSLYE